MKILAVNCGSSSVKVQLFEAAKGREFVPLFKCLASRIGRDGSYIQYSLASGKKIEIAKSILDVKSALNEIFGIITSEEAAVIITLNEIQAIGHRVVHGGNRFISSVVIDNEVIESIKENTKLAPLHNPVNVAGIEYCRKLLPNVPNIAVFDTAVHQTIPIKAQLYGLPIELYEKHGIRRYGFQGVSHNYVAREAANILQKPFESLKIITCHLGNGSSITAFKNGKSIDTSMGMTPLEGVMMTTRPGDIDPAIIPYLMEVAGFSLADIKDILNKRSGLLGLCGKSDMRDIIKLAESGDNKAQTAIDVFVYRIQKYIGSYIAAMNGVDAVVFTAGIGENSPYLRKRILENFEYLGLKIDKTRNNRNEATLSAADSKVYAMVIPTNEELAIAQDTYKIVAKREN
jgi:acetate kinase